MPSVCFVCLGNICRSPMAHAIFEHIVAERGLSQQWTVDSCGCGAWHVGERSDSRARKVLQDRGIRIDHRARQITTSDFTDFDWLLAMDGSNLSHIKGLVQANSTASIALLRDFDPHGPGDVPDPYYGGDDGFEQVFTMVERSCSAFLNEAG